jgi:hypothetical protein
VRLTSAIELAGDDDEPTAFMLKAVETLPVQALANDHSSPTMTTMERANARLVAELKSRVVPRPVRVEGLQPPH